MRAGRDVHLQVGAPRARPHQGGGGLAGGEQFDRHNALAYGRAPLDVTTTRHGDEVVVDVADRGPESRPATAAA
ncbi:MAG: hypothetical protein ACM3JC_09840 [Rudaea sp.]